MSLETVRARLVDRLGQADRGDRGWFVATRVHVAVSWLHGIAEFLMDRAAGHPVRLTAQDYQRLAEIAEINSPDPGVQLRRHHLLVMDKPLRLIQRTDNRSWAEVSLTPQGVELAHADDPARVLERSLGAIRFACEPWFPPNRVEQYSDFDLQVFVETGRVLEQCDGFIDRDEFDFFVSRIRTQGESSWAVECIREYRGLTTAEQRALRREVANRIPGDKEYQNWRDVALHTFSLFALGTSMMRDGQRLLLTEAWVERHLTADGQAEVQIPEGPPPLRMPELPEVEALLTPPAAPASNAGADGESFVAKVLRSQGWSVAFYTNRRGYGFDLWARRGDRAMVIEVKSSLANLGEITLTPTEYEAARHHRESFVLALVENLGGSSPQLRMIQNPLESVQVERRDIVSYAVSRAEWIRAAGLGI
ncbi:MAG: DUF3883 domain-containing protein [Phycisphaeraceae bacterium]|nr:DUF3883 domain-containing protein [Phycisphaeraceae bacterium]